MPHNFILGVNANAWTIASDIEVHLPHGYGETFIRLTPITAGNRISPVNTLIKENSMSDINITVGPIQVPESKFKNGFAHLAEL